MLDLMRKHATSWLIKVFLGAIIIVFSFWGIGSYQMNKANRVAEVNGNVITMAEYRQAYNEIVDRVRQRFGNKLDESMMEALQVEKQALTQVIDKRLLLEEAERLHLTVTDEELADAIRNVPAFQSNGRFDSRRYNQLLTANRMTPEAFEASQRESMALQRLQAFVSDGAVVSDAEIKQWYEWQNSSVNAQYVKFSPDAYPDVQADAGKAEAYFNDNKSAYKTQPKIKARFIRFASAAYLDKAQVSEDEVRDYYESHPEEFFVPKTVEARHILFRAAADAQEEDAAAAKAKAEDVLKQIQGGADFAEMAKTHSEGPSRESGGYLGAFKKQDMVKPFADKAFSMAAGEVSEPVRTDFGWHLIKVEKVNPESQKSFEEAKAGIRKQLEERKAKIAASDDAADVLDQAYDAEGLDIVAKDRSLALQTTQWFDKSGPSEEMTGDPQGFAEAAFALQAGDISDIVELKDGYYLIHVVDRQAEKIPAYEDVRERVERDLAEKMRKEKAAAEAESLLEKIKSGETLETAAAGVGATVKETGWITRRDAVPDLGYEPALNAEAFKLSKAKPLSQNVIAGNSGYFILNFLDRKAPENEEYDKQKERIQNGLLQQKQAKAFQTLLGQLKEKSEILIEDQFAKYMN